MRCTPHNPTPSARTASSRTIGSHAGFLFGCAAVFLAIFILLRVLLLIWNRDLTTGIPSTALVQAFWTGMRFDVVIVSYCAMPLALTFLFPDRRASRIISLYWLGFCGAITIFLGIAELEFYREFHARLNSLAFQYLKEDPRTVASMLWHGFPILRYLLLFGLVLGLYFGGLFLADRIAARWAKRGSRPHGLLGRLLAVVLFLLVAILGARGTLRSGPPLRWGDAYFSQHPFANHLGLNGTYTLAKAVESIGNEGLRAKWQQVLPRPEALTVTRRMLLTDRDELLEKERFAVLRRHDPVPAPGVGPIKNVVVIIMESFSAEFVGALRHGTGVTPEFDRLAAKGVLFDHFFSNGTHTHQGMFASVASFPNLPGFEYLMQQPQGAHAFSGLPVLLKERGFDDLYVYNGDFAWDNQEGFFRNQGMTRFIGRHDFRDPKVVNPTWGVSDEDMFDRALIELEEAAKRAPFFAVLQTLSNHTPYVLPSPLPFEPVKTAAGPLSEHLTAMKYSDWALGRFFREAEQAPYYPETLFVITGDHGFSTTEQLGGIDVLRFHVPLLLIGPGIQEAYGARRSVVGTQVDIVPTVMGALGKPFVHQSWGRNLLSLPEADAGFGVIKPSGSEQTTAIIRGDYILTRTPDDKSLLEAYRLYPQPHAEAVEDQHLTAALAKELAAYIETAMNSLYENTTGRSGKLSPSS